MGIKVPRWVQSLVTSHIKEEVKSVEECAALLGTIELENDKNDQKVLLRLKIKELEMKLESLKPANETGDLFNDLLNGNKTLDQIIAEVS